MTGLNLNQKHAPFHKATSNWLMSLNVS
ncbi:MAG: hypothetical protein QOI96_688, partial [Verrucomicrobiota bacterium]